MSQFFPANTSPDEMVYCMNVAKSLGLNPITKEIFFVPRRSKVGDRWINKIEPMLGRDSYIKIAHSTGLFEGIETYSEVKEVPKLINGKWSNESDLVATCKVYRKDTERPFIVNVAYSEYVQRTKNGEITKFWYEKPDTMLKKVAESQALRKAFNINGAYSIEEVNDVEVEPESERTQIKQVIPQPEPDINAMESAYFEQADGAETYDSKRCDDEYNNRQIEIDFETIDED